MMIVEGQEVGRFALEFEVANNQDINDALKGRIDPARIRRKKIKGTVDPGATLCVLPASVVKELGLPMNKGKVRVRYADGRRADRALADEVRVFLQGREATFNAIVEPKRETALIGAVVLETLDLLVDSRRERLVPRDPEIIEAKSNDPHGALNPHPWRPSQLPLPAISESTPLASPPPPDRRRASPAAACAPCRDD